MYHVMCYLEWIFRVRVRVRVMRYLEWDFRVRVRVGLKFSAEFGHVLVWRTLINKSSPYWQLQCALNVYSSNLLMITCLGNIKLVRIFVLIGAVWCKRSEWTYMNTIYVLRLRNNSMIRGRLKSQSELSGKELILDMLEPRPYSNGPRSFA